MLAIKLHLRNHQISSVPFSKIVRSQRTPLFQVQPIQTSCLSPLQLKPRRQSLKGFNASYVEGLEQSNSNGGGGGGIEDPRKERGGDGGGGGGKGGVEIMRVFLRWVEFLLGSDLENGGMVALPAKVALLCAQAIQQLHLVLMEIGNAFVQYTFVGALLIAAAITFVFLHYF